MMKVHRETVFDGKEPLLMKKPAALALALLLLLSACAAPQEEAASGEPVSLYIFAASSLAGTLDQIIELYQAEHQDIAVVPTYDSSGTLLAQIQEGADCDLFISAAPKQMDALEVDAALLEGSRRDLLENKVVLAVPEGNPRGVGSFRQLASLLESGDVLLAVGNSDVPVGQYTQKIFAYLGLDEDSLAASGLLTYGSNVKEVTTQVSEASVDCGIIYATDAFDTGLTVMDEALPEMCGQVVYPAAVLARSHYPEEAGDFLTFLSSGEAGLIFKNAGFTTLNP
jgi:molybdate transport system substrate-binding protein